MNYTKNYNLGLPELDEQYDLNVVNNNNTKIDEQMKVNADAVATEKTRATEKENQINDTLTTEKSTTKSHIEDKSNPHNVTKEQLGLGKVENNTNNELKQMIFDMMNPIADVEHGISGKRWIQLPGEDSPQVMFNRNGIKSTWEDITKYVHNQFLKFDMYNPCGTVFPESLPNIRGSFSLLGADGGGFFASPAPTEAFTVAAARAPGFFGYGGDDNVHCSKTIVFNAALTNPIWKDNAKVQPYNVTVKYWMRTK